MAEPIKIKVTADIMHNSTTNSQSSLSRSPLQKVDVVHLSTSSKILALIEKQDKENDLIFTQYHSSTNE